MKKNDRTKGQSPKSKPAITRSRPKATPSTGKKIWGRLFWIIPVLVIVAYASLFRQEFINYDDDWMIYENHFITDFSTGQVRALFSTFYYGQYSPAAMTVMGALFTIGGGKVILLKLGALIIHLLNCFLVYYLFKKITRDVRIAFFATAAFAIHPVQVESVAWLSAVYKVGLFSFFTLSGLLAWMEYLRTKKVLWYAGTLLLMIMACFTKEQALIFPFFLLLLNFVNDNYRFRKNNLIRIIPFLIISAVFLVVTFMAVKSYSQVIVRPYSLIERIYFLSYSFVSYFRLFLFPFKLAPFYPFPEQTIGGSGYVVFPLLTLVLILLIFRGARRNQLVLTGILFFLVSILLTFAIQVVSVRDTLYADRYLYMGIPGLFVALVAGAETLARKNLNLVWGIIIMLFLILSLHRVSVFRNSETLWTDAINKNYKNALAFNNRGHYYRQKGETDKAIADYNMALKADPKFYLSLNNRGKVFFDRGEVDRALEDFNKALAIAPNFANALSNRGAAFGMKMDNEKAMADLNRAIELDPENINALSNRGFLFFSLQEYEKSIQDYETYLKYKPDDPDILNTIGVCHLRQARYEEAVRTFNKSIQINPGRGDYYLNRAYTHELIGNINQALSDANRAAELGTRVPASFVESLKIKLNTK